MQRHESARPSTHQWLTRHLVAAAACCVASLGSLHAQDAEPLRHTRTKHFLAQRASATTDAATALDRARRQHLTLLQQNVHSSAVLGAAWTPVGPRQIATHTFGLVTGRVTAIAADPTDSSGNTLYLGTTGGGVWKSTNAVGLGNLVTFKPLTDSLPVFDLNSGSSAIASLSIGAVAVGGGVVLAGTGDPNDATDSYYGAGILRSVDGGNTWSLAQGSLDGAAGNHSFFGLSVAGLAFSSMNTSTAVAALSQAAESALVNAGSTPDNVMGLYYTHDAGLTWHMATLLDGNQIVQQPLPSGANGPGNAATSVVWNPLRQRFYAAVRQHGYYESVDGMTWTRLTHQPALTLAASACPANPGSVGSMSCPVARGVLAVQPVTGDTFAFTVDATNHDQGLYQDVCTPSTSSCASSTMLFGTRLNSAPLGGGNIAQGDYNLALAAVPTASDTLLLVGTEDLYRCSLASGCALRNTTNAQNGCATPAGVSSAQHALTAVTTAGNPLVFVGNDGGLYRSSDGIAQQGTACNADDATHFENLNAALGSLGEISDFAQSPTDATALLAGFGAQGTARAGSPGTAPWLQLSTGEGGTVAIDQNDPTLWYISRSAGVSIARCTHGAACTSADFAQTTIGPAQVNNDPALIHAPWLLDPAATGELLLGTCRLWRGPADSGATWSVSNAISRPFGAPNAPACGSTSPLVRVIAAGGAQVRAGSIQNSGSRVLYAGLAGVLSGGQGFGGHLFMTNSADTATSATVWKDVAQTPVTNDPQNANLFNPGQFDVSAIAVDSHDVTGATVYATIMGFAGNGINAPHIYRSVDGGAHWMNISSNLPNAPANSVLVDPNDANTIYVALDTGVYVTTQVGLCVTTNCWSVYGISLPNAPVIKLLAAASLPTGEGRSGLLRAATYGRGIWQIPLLTATAPATPRISLSPADLSFPAQQTGTLSAVKTILVTNSGDAALTITSITAGVDFVESDTCRSAPIAINGTCAIQVQFLPSAAGLRNSTLTVFGNAPGGQATANLTGTGTSAAVIVLTPTALTFPQTIAGSRSAVQNITIANTGGTSVTITSAPQVSRDFVIAASTCSTSLPPQNSCTVSVIFAPVSAGMRTGTLALTDDAGTQSASLIGLGAAPPTDTLNLPNLNFPTQQQGTVSAAQTITVTNSGDVPLTLIAATIVSGDFSVVNGCGSTLVAHASCALLVTFAPTRTGAQDGVLHLADFFRTQTVALNGLGIAPPGVSLSPAGGLTFGAVGLGLNASAQTTAQTVALTNNGGVPLTIQSITTTGDFTLVAGLNTCGNSLAPAATCTAAVAFTPSTTGLRSGQLRFTDGATGSPQILALSGTGVNFTLSPNGATSITIASGNAATYALLLASDATVPGVATFTCAGVPAHATCTVNPVAAALGGTTLITVTVATGLATALAPALPAGWIGVSALGALSLLGLVGKRRSVQRYALAICICALIAAAGCSTGRTIPDSAVAPAPIAVTTPSGTYPLLISSSSAGLVRSITVTLIVK